jgi:hypothetical protein
MLVFWVATQCGNNISEETLPPSAVLKLYKELESRISTSAQNSVCYIETSVATQKFRVVMLKFL